jgi:hypothetical protein
MEEISIRHTGRVGKNSRAESLKFGGWPVDRV